MRKGYLVIAEDYLLRADVAERVCLAERAIKDAIRSIDSPPLLNAQLDLARLQKIRMTGANSSKVRFNSGTISQKTKFGRTLMTGTTVKSGTNVLRPA